MRDFVYIYNTSLSSIHSRSFIFVDSSNCIRTAARKMKKKNMKKMEWIVKCVLFIVRNITAVEWLSVIHIFLLAFIVCVFFFFFSNFLLFRFLFRSLSLVSFGFCRTYTNILSVNTVTVNVYFENAAERKSVIYSRKIQYGFFFFFFFL